MSASTNIFDSVAPELIMVPTETKEFWLEFAATVHTPSAWGNAYSVAMAAYAAHCMKQSGIDELLNNGEVDGGAMRTGGAATSRKAGDVSIAYGAASIAVMKAKTLGDAELMETRYGRMYLRLRGSRAACHAQVVLVDGGALQGE